jgi:hypothetical protein
MARLGTRFLWDKGGGSSAGVSQRSAICPRDGQAPDLHFGPLVIS